MFSFFLVTTPSDIDRLSRRPAVFAAPYTYNIDREMTNTQKSLISKGAHREILEIHRDLYVGAIGIHRGPQVAKGGHSDTLGVHTSSRSAPH